MAPATDERAGPGARRGLWAERWPEIALFVLGAALRASMLANYDARSGYDFADHGPYVDWFVTHSALPPLELTRATYHPPLYYALGGLLGRLGVASTELGALAVVLGILRLALFLLGLELYLPERPAARRFALAVAAVLPASVQLDGMVTNECLLAFLSMAALLALPSVVEASGRARWARAAGLGLVVGLALLTKISAFALVAAAAAAALLDAGFAAHRSGGARAAWRRLAPWSAFVFALVVVDGWYFRHNVAAYGKPVISGFDGADAFVVAESSKLPLSRRRAPDFFYGWTADIYDSPYFPSGLRPRSTFWPPLVASTFVDYYNYRYAGAPDEGESFVWRNDRRLPERALLYSRLSVVGGTLLAASVLAAWVLAARWLWRRRDAGRLALLVVPLVATAGQLYFATLYPVDDEGMVKGVYMQFAAPPLWALSGVAADALWRSPRWRALSLVLAAALALVAAYSCYCRFR